MYGTLDLSLVYCFLWGFSEQTTLSNDVGAVVKLCCKRRYFMPLKALYVVSLCLASLGSLPALQNFGFPNINH